MAVQDILFKVRSAPGHVIIVLLAQGKESREVGESDETLLGMEIVDEREFRSRVAQGGQILEERNLHAGVRKKHTRMPYEAPLSFNVQDSGVDSPVMKSDSDGQRRRSESDTYEIVLVLRTYARLRSCFGGFCQHCGRCRRSIGKVFILHHQMLATSMLFIDWSKSNGK